MKKINIFVSSPGDLSPERHITKQIVKKLQTKLAGRLQLDGFFWEDEPVLATESFQTQFPRAAMSDVFICLLWSRIGTPLPEGAVFEDGTPILRPDGTPYESGTVAEFEDALKAYDLHQQPTILMYFKTAEVQFNPESPDFPEKQRQYEGVKQFFRKWFQDEQGRFPRACVQFNTLTEFAHQLETHLCKLLVDRFLPQDSHSRKLCVLTWDGYPYTGLSPFTLEQAAIFFGRNQAIDDIYEALQQQAAKGQALLMILGAVGSGKTSLVQAGLLPLFLQLQISCHIVRPKAIGAAMLVTALQHTIASINVNTSSHIPQAILFVDQFEELFTLNDITEADREAFIRLLVETATDCHSLSGQPSIWVVIALRSEWQHYYQRYVRLISLLESKNIYHLQFPTPSELRQMIEEPTKAAGLVFEHPAKRPPLNEVILDDISAYHGHLALLQFTLSELYQDRQEDNLTYQAYRELGGIAGALAQYAEQTLKRLNKAARDAFPELMRTLITVNKDTGQAILGRRLLLSEQQSLGMKELITGLMEAHLLVTEELSTGDRVAKLVHEALLSDWPRVQEWWLHNQEFLRIRLRINYAASYWQDEGRPNELLLQEGKALEDARYLLEQWSDAITQNTRDYIHTSHRQVEQQRRIEITKAHQQLKRSRHLALLLLLMNAIMIFLFINVYCGN
ncbi:hypothetical protein [Thioflexithrix psekupsensis]|uniref:Novel STAND NTPase 1 domain-containing protein n=1 Tax=Thioflexithrix psekupsensis TaxID=1570016 RepID=A0A251XBW2_9GAMM|nr:hypothetical protein [Thioflexithrix psekupsensis]OUD16217.1 hypothetical protein TPSD3_00375 [Thioflexithrix psekupsensis]